jgi:polar amino acid transport system ATP-binding protein
MGFACSVATEILFMENGLIAEQGSPETLMNDPQYTRTKNFLGQFID